MNLLRGRVYLVDLGLDEAKRVLVVSNNRRNAALGTALGVRLTTSEKPDLPSIVEVDAADGPVRGRVVCDDVVTVWEDEVRADVGALSRATMSRVEGGLRAAFDLR